MIQIRLVQTTFTQPPSPQQMVQDGSPVSPPRPVRTRRVLTNHPGRSVQCSSETVIPGVYSYSVRIGAHYDITPEEPEAPGALRVPAQLLPGRSTDGVGGTPPCRVCGTFPGATGSPKGSVKFWTGDQGEQEQQVDAVPSSGGPLISNHSLQADQSSHRHLNRHAHGRRHGQNHRHGHTH